MRRYELIKFIVALVGTWKEVSAYVTDTPGLVVHPLVELDESQDEYIETSAWQVAHQSSGRALNTDQNNFRWLDDAMRFAWLLRDVADWTISETAYFAINTTIIRQVREIYQSMEPGYTTALSLYVSRFGIGYAVVDKSTDEIVEQCAHRGQAWRRANEIADKRVDG
jgi:hypothetical protein